MTTLAFPVLSVNPGTFEWRLESNTQILESPLTKAVQTIEQPGARWSATLGYINLIDPDVALLQAFLAQLRGMANRFTLANFERSTPRGIATGTPLVNGASQTGTSLNTKGWTASQTGIMKAGDYFTVNGELKMMAADANSDGTGLATLVFEPPLRASPADNAALTVNSPTATFMLRDSKVGWPRHAPAFRNFTIDCIEQF